jgi:superfamily I DNA and RNA helicase
LETDFIANSIENDIRNEYLNPEDICVISLDQTNIGAYFEVLEKKLKNKQINVFNLLDAPSNNTHFAINNHVTLSTINKAKGNEMGMVYILGVDFVFSNKDYIINRNQLFTAITRSKGWVKLTGYKKAELCAEELNKLKANKYQLIFNQPSSLETKTIYRGMDKIQTELNDLSRRLEIISKQTGMSLEELLKTIESQNIKK